MAVTADVYLQQTSIELYEIPETSKNWLEITP
jgi:hypothetical protein